MRIIEKKIYKFDELNKEIQEKLIKEEKEYCYNAYMEDFFQDDIGSITEDLVNDYFGITDNYIKPYYDFSYCQGSGAMIEFDINIEDLNKKYKIFSDEEMRFLTDKGIVNNIEVRHNDSHYYHEYTFGLDFIYYGMGYSFEDCIDEGYKISEEDFNTLENRVCDLLDDSNKHYTKSVFITDIINMNKELTNRGYSIVSNYEEDTDLVIEHLNDYEYYENGEVCYE